MGNGQYSTKAAPNNLITVWQQIWIKDGQVYGWQREKQPLLWEFTFLLIFFLDLILKYTFTVVYSGILYYYQF